MKYVEYAVLFFLFSIHQNMAAQTIKLTWSPNPEPDTKYYYIYKDTVTSPQQEISRVPAADTSYIDHNIIIGKKYYYRITAVDSAQNQSEFSDEIYIIAEKFTPPQGGSSSELIENNTITTVVNHKFDLYQNYPNPFNPETTIYYTTAREGNVALVILDIMGKRVRKLVDEYKNVGSYIVKWNGKNDGGYDVSTGIYLCQMIFDGGIKIKKIILTK